MAKRIVILGAGESGAGAAVLAKKQGFDTFVSDMSTIKDTYKNMLNERGIEWEEGKHTESLILNADEVIKSPGIPNDAPMILKLKSQGTPIISEIEFAGRYTNAKMICITGSNGKTTTTSLIYHIFKKAGMNVGLAGNIGQSLAYQVAECNYDYYVIELSSFQLDNMYKFHANIAVLMNITPDHLDRYDHQMQNYVDAKFRIIQNQTPDDAFIFWNDDPVIQRELHKYGIHGHYYPFAERKEEGTAAYVEQDKVYFTEPIAFNMEQEDIDEYLKIQGATKEELSAFENQFQIRLPEDFKTVYSYKNGSGYMSLIWPQEGFYRGYRLLSLKEIIKLKSLFQNKNCKMTEFPNVIGEKQLQQLDERIKPYLFCERWFPFAEYAGSLYLMLDYNPSEKGEIGQIICYVHDPDFIYYVAPNITEALKMTETVIENLI